MGSGGAGVFPPMELPLPDDDEGLSMSDLLRCGRSVQPQQPPACELPPDDDEGPRP